MPGLRANRSPGFLSPHGMRAEMITTSCNSRLRGNPVVPFIVNSG